MKRKIDVTGICQSKEVSFWNIGINHCDAFGDVKLTSELSVLKSVIGDDNINTMLTQRTNIRDTIA